MHFNRAAQTCWGILGDQLSMTNPACLLACLPACWPASQELDISKGNVPFIFPKVQGTRVTEVILSDSNDHILILPDCMVVLGINNVIRRQAEQKLRERFVNLPFFILKFTHGQVVKLMTHLDFLLLFLYFKN